MQPETEGTRTARLAPHLLCPTCKKPVFARDPLRRAVLLTGHLGRVHNVDETTTREETLPYTVRPEAPAVETHEPETLFGVSEDPQSGEMTIRLPPNESHMPRQLRAVRDAMSDGRWYTLSELQEATGFQETSISARLRELNRQHGYVVNKEPNGKGNGWRYKLRRR